MVSSRDAQPRTAPPRAGTRARGPAGAPARRLSAPHHRSRVHHSLAPAHMGDAVGLASVGMAVVGVALVIASVAVLVMAATLGSRYAVGGEPPNLNELRLGQLLLGVALLAIGLLLIGIVVAVFRDVRAARWMGAATNGVLAIASLAGVGWLVSRGPQADVVLAVTLGLLAIFFAAAAVAYATRFRLLPMRRG